MEISFANLRVQSLALSAPRARVPDGSRISGPFSRNFVQAIGGI